MTRAQRIFPWIIVALVAVYVVSVLVPQQIESEYDYAALSSVPVSSQGRIKPLDSVARNSLLIVSGRQTLMHDGRRLQAIQWLADVLARPEVASNYEVFRIDHPDVLALIGSDDPKRKRFSFNELTPQFSEIARQGDLAMQVQPKKRDPFQKHILSLYDRLGLYTSLGRWEAPYAVAPLHDGESWQPLAAVLAAPNGGAQPSASALRAILAAYDKQDSGEFNRQLSAYHDLLKQHIPSAINRAGYEVTFNAIQIFYQTSVLYVVGFLLACVGFLMSCRARQGWAQSLGRATMAVLIIAFALHTLGLGSRIYLQGRPPVTNLYSSAVFIGWFCVLLGIIIERLMRIGLGAMAASAVGFGTLIVAHHLSTTGDTMEMMQAVLDSNFWLATHVVTVTIGYSATFLAGFLGVTYIVLGVLTPVLKADLAKSLSQMIYGVICFAALLSFVGTVLGGIWADQSWGRFWGWDPKENGAILIVFMNLLTLHARWGGLIKHRGMAVLAVLGNIITAWSWFGTNMLGVGLHSYGFMDSAVFWILAFAGSQLAIMALGLLPLSLWRSHTTRLPKARHNGTPATA